MPRWKWILSQLSRRLWLRASMIGLIGVLAAVLAAVAERFIPWEIPYVIGSDAVDSILNIIATSMLTVTTFSLSVMITAYGSATSNVTPRATTLLVEDRLTQNVLSTFLGSFLYSIVGIVVLKTGAYGDRGRVILFVVTIGVIALIVVSLLRWIDHLTKLGRVGETTTRVEDAASTAIRARLKYPFLGGVPLREPEREIPRDAVPIPTGTIAYLKHIDMTALSACADAYETDIYLAGNPGMFVYEGTPLAWWRPALKSDDGGDAQARVRAAFTTGPERSFDQDPRFGLIVMSEIASRALSRGINDPGTAIDVIGRSARLLSLWAKPEAVRYGKEDGYEPAHPRVHVPPLSTADMFEDAFLIIARDGAAQIEVQLRLQKCLKALCDLGDAEFRSAARAQAEQAMARAETALTFEADRKRLMRDL